MLNIEIIVLNYSICVLLCRKRLHPTLLAGKSKRSEFIFDIERLNMLEEIDLYILLPLSRAIACLSERKLTVDHRETGRMAIEVVVQEKEAGAEVDWTPSSLTLFLSRGLQR